MKILKVFSVSLILTSSAAFAFDTGHLERLRATGSCEKCDLSKAQLRGASNLVGANLNGANLSGADLSGATLDGAILTNAVGVKRN